MARKLVSRAPKGTKLRADVIRAVESMVAGQLRPSQIVAALAENPKFELSHRQGHRYIQHVRDLIAREDDEDKPRHRHYIRATLRLVVQRALARDQLSAAVAAVDRIARLDGLYAETKVDIRHSGSIDQRYVDMTREDRRARLNELFTLYANGGEEEAADAGEPDAN